MQIIAQLEKPTQINGVVVILDFEGLSMKQIKAMTPAATKRLLTFIQEAMPLRLKELHVVKQPFIFNLVWAMLKPFIKEKLKTRVSDHHHHPHPFWWNSSVFILLIYHPSDVPAWRWYEKTSQIYASRSFTFELWRITSWDYLFWKRMVSFGRKIFWLC